MKYRIVRETNNQPIDFTLAPGIAWQLEEIRVHLGAGGAAGDLTATVDAAAGAPYDVVVLTQDMNGTTDVVYQPTRPIIFNSGDELDIAYSNTGAATYGLEVVYSAI